jgi:hypothetical protein
MPYEFQTVNMGMCAQVRKHAPSSSPLHRRRERVCACGWPLQPLAHANKFVFDPALDATGRPWWKTTILLWRGSVHRWGHRVTASREPPHHRLGFHKAGKTIASPHSLALAARLRPSWSLLEPRASGSRCPTLASGWRTHGWTQSTTERATHKSGSCRCVSDCRGRPQRAGRHAVRAVLSLEASRARAGKDGTRRVSQNTCHRPQQVLLYALWTRQRCRRSLSVARGPRLLQDTGIIWMSLLPVPGLAHKRRPRRLRRCVSK